VKLLLRYALSTALPAQGFRTDNPGSSAAPASLPPEPREGATKEGGQRKRPAILDAFVNVKVRPYYAEGSKTLAYEVAEQLGWRLPDQVVVPSPD
jgi:hypothetical protein